MQLYAQKKSMHTCTEEHTSRSMNSIKWTLEEIDSFIEDDFDRAIYDNFIIKISSNRDYRNNFIKNSHLLFDNEGNLHSHYYKGRE